MKKTVLYPAAGALSCIIMLIFMYMVSGFFKLQGASLPARKMAADGEFININGFNLSCRVLNPCMRISGKTIIVVHGGPGMSSAYFSDSLDFLSKEYRLIYYDQRGSGFSQIKSHLKHYTFKKLVKELHSVKKHFCQDEPVILLGHSYGTLLALEYVKMYKMHIKRLMLISPLRLKRDIVEKHSKYDLFKIPSPEMTNRIYRKYLGFIFKKTFMNKKACNRLYLGYTSYAPAVAISNSKGTYNYINTENVKFKVLIIYGKKDLYGGKEIRKYEKIFPRLKILQFRKSGHWPFLEEENRFKMKVKLFLSDD